MAVRSTPETTFHLADDGERIRRYLIQHLSPPESGAQDVLWQAAQHALSATGKLVRPLLLLDACRAVQGDPEVAFGAAAGTEYGHLASLVHDDVMDGDDQRRGQQAVNARYGLGPAILTGDLFIFQMFLNYAESVDRGAKPERVVEAIRLLSTTCLQVCHGQSLEVELVGNLAADEALYLRVIQLKTASVCRAATEIGACLGGGTQKQIAALGRYGEALGMAFQVLDDVLPYASQGADLGKPAESDLRNHRVTLPIIYALQAADPDQRHQLEDAFAQGDFAALTGVLHATGALRRARATAEEYTRCAQRELMSLPPSEALNRLQTLASLLLVRSF